MMTRTMVKPSGVLKVRIKFLVAGVCQKMVELHKSDYLVDFSSSINQVLLSLNDDSNNGETFQCAQSTNQVSCSRGMSRKWLSYTKVIV